MERLKVLVSAYACHPEQGSEPGVGWNWLKEIARHHDVWLLTEAERFAPATESALESHQLRDAVKVIGIPRERRAERWLKSLAYYHTYERWQRAALERARELHRHVGFDVIHQLNMIGYREPGFLWSLDVPFVWGPIGGFAQMPWRYLHAMGPSGAMSLGFRNLANEMQMRLSRRVRAAMQASDVLISATSVDRVAIAKLYGRQAPVVHETGTAPESEPIVRTIREGERLRVLWCGRMVPSKAVGVALQAVARASRTIPIEFHLCGDGPQQPFARGLAEQLGIQGLCYFHGQRPRAEVIDRMRSSHVLFFPSLKEATSATVPEALATGLPVLCHDTCGHGDIVTKEVGIGVPVSDPPSSVEAFANALVSLSHEPERLRAYSIAAAEGAPRLAWSAKGDAADAWYREAIANRQSRGYLLSGS
ncbi:glycosyltransferase family 4 protein [Steroidobacter flavus]|uniref:Glycosyltransferase family 4 protein n=1 Tax=Steroidobacter flavus TaxID=1842136 RepID=A0ABV8SLT1_9GAMM